MEWNSARTHDDEVEVSICEPSQVHAPDDDYRAGGCHGLDACSHGSVDNTATRRHCDSGNAWKRRREGNLVFSEVDVGRSEACAAEPIAKDSNTATYYPQVFVGSHRELLAAGPHTDVAANIEFCGGCGGTDADIPSRTREQRDVSIGAVIDDPKRGAD